MDKGFENMENIQLDFKEQKNKGVKIDVSGKQKAIMITTLCNNHCIMCHSSTNYKIDYSTREIMKAIEDTIDGSEKEIQLSGGEPTLRKDLIQILKKIKELNSRAEIQINTNGRMFFYKELVKSISNLNIVGVIMTDLHAHNAELHDKITQVNGSFIQVVQGIKNLLDENIKVKIVVLINKLNYKFLPEIASFIKRNFEDVEVSFNYTWFVYNAYKDRYQLFVKVNDITYYLERAADILKENCVFMHFPICIFGPEYQNYVVKQSFIAGDREDYPSKECGRCNLKNKCGGIWRNYSELNGEEFKPIIKNENSKKSSSN